MNDDVKLTPEQRIEVAADLIEKASRAVWRAVWNRFDASAVIVDHLSDDELRSAAYEAHVSHRTVLKWAQQARLVPPESRVPELSPREQIKRARGL